MTKKRSRRAFVGLGLKSGLGLPLLRYGLPQLTIQPHHRASLTNRSKSKLDILILGGTSFLGPHQIAYAMARGHNITTFTRGKSKPTIYQELFNDVESLIGDREDNLTALQGRKWDAVIDNSGRKAAWTKDTATMLKDSCDLYLYTSSTGVYYPYLDSDVKEDAAVVHTVPEGINREDQIEYDYGVMKANSEEEAIRQFGRERTIVVRPTYMFGPADRTDRFIYWPIRVSRGGEIMVPGKVEDPVQYIDVRDVAEWMIRLIEEKKSGTYNAVGPRDMQHMHSFVDEAREAFDVPSSVVRIHDYDFLKKNNVRYIIPWIMPEGNNWGSARINNDKAKEHGLSFRPLTQSIRDTHGWWHSDAVSQERRDKVERDPNSILYREKTIIKQWQRR